jgi:hypothetical protein
MSQLTPPKWYSLHNLLEQYSTAILATAIEQSGVFVYDRFNRVVMASSTDVDDFSQYKALALLADWQAELNNPGPTNSWDHEKFELEAHPTQNFGWPEGKLPPLDGASPVAVNSLVVVKISAKAIWVAAAQKEALSVLARERQNNIEPKQDQVARDVESALKARGVKTVRGDITWENIKREALAGEFWRRTRRTPKN